MFASLFYFFNCRAAAAATAAVKLNKKSEAKAADEFQGKQSSLYLFNWLRTTWTNSTIWMPIKLV